MTMKLDEKILNQVKEILENLKGKEEAITSNKIAEMVGIDPGPSNVKIRSYIREILRRHHLPIASAGTKGYYFITNEQEFNAYIKTLQSYIRNTTARMVWVTRNYSKYYDEEELELTGEVIGLKDEDEEEEE